MEVHKHVTGVHPGDSEDNALNQPALNPKGVWIIKIDAG